MFLLIPLFILRRTWKNHSHRERGTMPRSSSQERRPRSGNIELLPCQNLLKVAFHVPKSRSLTHRPGSFCDTGQNQVR
uniref:Uncharacterized protein n=1 Tax=Arundo donax TaxID=35708 RepID=A0A0A9DZK8_ARUDO